MVRLNGLGGKNIGEDAFRPIGVPSIGGGQSVVRTGHSILKAKNVPKVGKDVHFAFGTRVASAPKVGSKKAKSRVGLQKADGGMYVEQPRESAVLKELKKDSACHIEYFGR